MAGYVATLHQLMGIYEQQTVARGVKIARECQNQLGHERSPACRILAAMDAAAHAIREGARYCENIPRDAKPLVVDWTLPRIAFIGDSWLKEQRFMEMTTGSTSLDGVRLVNLAPHTVVGLNGFEKEVDSPHALLLNLSRGSLTMRKTLKHKPLLKKWVEYMPDVTVIGVGACDLVTEGLRLKNPRVEYPEAVLTFLLQLKEVATLHFEAIQWTWWYGHHRFLVLRPNDWADFVSNRATMTAEEYREVRREVDRGFKRKAAKLYAQARAVVFAPWVDQVHLSGVHLGAVQQQQFNRQVVAAAARLICADCALPQDYLASRHTNILQCTTICHLKPPVSCNMETIVRKWRQRLVKEEKDKRRGSTKKRVPFKLCKRGGHDHRASVDTVF